jgi:hypothetical protein
MAFWLRLRLCRLFSCLAAASLAWRLPLGRRAAAGQPGVPMPPPGKAPPMETFSHAEVLLSRRAELQSEVRRLSTKLARAKSVQRAVERRSKSLTAETTPEKHRRLILCAFWIVNCVSRDCLVLLEHVRSPPVWGSLDADGRAALVEALFLAVDLDELESWMTPESPENRMRMQELWILDAEWRTARWVFDTNSVHGVAPSSSKVVDVYREKRLLAPPEFQPRAFARSLGARRLWAMRWRRRWDASVGVLKTGDMDPRDVLRQKAAGEGGGPPSPTHKGAAASPTARPAPRSLNLASFPGPG